MGHSKFSLSSAQVSSSSFQYSYTLIIGHTTTRFSSRSDRNRGIEKLSRSNQIPDPPRTRITSGTKFVIRPKSIKISLHLLPIKSVPMVVQYKLYKPTVHSTTL